MGAWDMKRGAALAGAMALTAGQTQLAARMDVRAGEAIADPPRQHSSPTIAEASLRPLSFMGYRRPGKRQARFSSSSSGTAENPAITCRTSTTRNTTQLSVTALE